MQPSNDNKSRDSQGQGLKRIGELLSGIISVEDARLPNSEHTPRSERSPIAPKEIRKLIDAGRIDEGLQAARDLYEFNRDTFSPEGKLTVIALANLLEHATRVRRPQTDLSQKIFELEKYWARQDVSNGSGSFIMHILPRTCEYAAQFGRVDEALRGLAERSLKCLHYGYLLFQPVQETAEANAVKQYAASAAIRAAAHISWWNIRNKQPDLRWVRYVADCSRERLAIFSPSQATFYYALFQFESGRPEAWLASLKSLIDPSLSTDSDIRIASLDQLTGWYIRVNELDKATNSLESLRAELVRDAADSSSAMRDNLRVRTEEALRLRSYETALRNALGEG